MIDLTTVKELRALRLPGMALQIASPNGHLCHIRRTARDIISGQTGTH